MPQPKPSTTQEEDYPALPEPSWEPPVPRSDPGALRRGGKVTVVAGLFAFVGWGIWAAANRGGPTTPLFTLVVVAGVAAGIFTLSRLVGRIVLEQRMGRARHSARGSHALTALFLFGAGVAYLKQVPWVVQAITWLDGFVN